MHLRNADMQIERKNDRESKCINRKRKSDRDTERKEVLDKKTETYREEEEKGGVREKDNECVCVCVRERERERERGRGRESSHG